MSSSSSRRDSYPAGRGAREEDLARVFIPAGEFSMGSWVGRADEKPVRRVFVSEFEMAITPVTNLAYRRYLEATEATAPPWWEDPQFNRPHQPVVGVNWFEARDYCEWLSAETGFKLRLPTEAEREKAARGGRIGQVFPWGNVATDGGHPTIRGPLAGPDEVATLPPNGFGLYNMADTVHEWCLDGYRGDGYRSAPSNDPVAPSDDVGRRSARGGSWRHRVVVTPCSARSSLPPHLHYSDFGFRWVRAER